MADAAIASIRGLCIKARAEKDHAKFVMFCEINSVRRRMAAAAIASLKGSSGYFNVENDQAVFAISCEPNVLSEHMRRAAADRDYLQGWCPN